MRQITVKFDGECRRCGNDIPAPARAYHEKYIGLFCIGCEPADSSNELREYRQEARDRRDEKLAERAKKRRAKADALCTKRDAHLMSDIAFTTQPGHIPERERIFKRREKAAKLYAEADAISSKASGSARVKGDAARRDEKQREKVRGWIKPGMRVHHGILGPATVEKVNRKTARIRLDSTGNCYAEDMIFIGPL